MSGAANNDFPYLRIVLWTALGAAVLGAYPFAVFTPPEIARAAAAGLVLSVIHAVIGFGVVRFTAGRPFSESLNIVLGGIVVRLVVMTALLLVAVGLFRFHAFALIGTLFVFYIIFLAMEVLYIHRSMSQQQST